MIGTINPKNKRGHHFCLISFRIGAFWRFQLIRRHSPNQTATGNFLWRIISVAPSSNERFRSSIREPILVQFLGIHRNIQKGEWGGAPAIILYQQNRLTPIAKSATVPGKKKKSKSPVTPLCTWDIFSWHVSIDLVILVSKIIFSSLIYKPFYRFIFCEVFLTWTAKGISFS